MHKLIYYILIIIILGITPIFYFLDGKTVLGGDTNFHLDPSYFLYRSQYTWEGDVAMGYPNTLGILNTFPYASFLQVGQIIHLPLFLNQALLLSLGFMGMGLAMFFLTYSLLKKKNYLIPLIAAIVYMFNYYTVQIWRAPDFINFSFHILYPLLLGVFIWGIDKPNYIRQAMIFGLASLLFPSANLNIPLMVLMWLTIGLYFVWSLFFSENNKIRIFKYFICSIIFYSLLNMWWLLPLSSFLSWAITALNTSLPVDWLMRNSQYASFHRLFRLFGLGPSKFIYENNIFFVIFGYFLFGIIILGLIRFFKQKREYVISKKNILFLYFLLFLALFFSKGGHDPGGKVYIWMMNYVPYFYIFRSGFQKFASALSVTYSILLAFGLYFLFSEIQKVRNKKIKILCFILFLAPSFIYIYPFWQNKLISNGQEWPLPSFHVNPPSYYDEAKNWIEKDKEEFRILSLPGQPNWSVYNFEEVATDGADYLGVDLNLGLINKSIIKSTPEVDDYGKHIYKKFHYGDLENLEKLLALLNVKYLLLHQDAYRDLFGGDRPPYIEAILKRADFLTFSKKIGREEFYQLKPPYFIERFYLPNEKIYFQGDVEQSLEALNFVKDNNKKAVIFINDYQRKDFYNNLNNRFIEEADIIMIKLNPTVTNKIIIPQEGYYKVLIKNNERVNKNISQIFLKKGENDLSSLPSLNPPVTTLLLENKKPKAILPLVQFTRINPTKYEVLIKSASKPFLLVFSEAFDKSWKIYYKRLNSQNPILNSLSWLSKPDIEEKDHFKVNSFANAWWIDLNQVNPVLNTGQNSPPQGDLPSGKKIKNYIENPDGSIDLELIIEFWPQRLFYLGLLISGITLVGNIIYLVWGWRYKLSSLKTAINNARFPEHN